MMPPSILQAIRDATAARRLDRDGELIPITRVDTDSGGSTVESGTALPIRMGLASGMSGQQELEQRLLDRIGNRPFFIVLVNAGTIVKDDDEIKQLNPTIRRFKVLGILNEQISFETLRRVVVVEAATEDD